MGMTVMKCKVCGAPHAVCGPRTTVIPVDSNVTGKDDRKMSELKPYEVVIPGRGGGTRTTLLLSDEDAKRQGVFGKEQKPKARAASNKARGAANKAAKSADTKTEPPADAGTDE